MRRDEELRSDSLVGKPFNDQRDDLRFSLFASLADGIVTSPVSSGQTSKGVPKTWAMAQIDEGKIPVQKAALGNVPEELVTFLTGFLFKNSLNKRPSFWTAAPQRSQLVQEAAKAGKNSWRIAKSAVPSDRCACFGSPGTVKATAAR